MELSGRAGHARRRENCLPVENPEHDGGESTRVKRRSRPFCARQMSAQPVRGVVRDQKTRWASAEDGKTARCSRVNKQIGGPLRKEIGQVEQLPEKRGPLQSEAAGPR